MVSVTEGSDLAPPVTRSSVVPFLKGHPLFLPRLEPLESSALLQVSLVGSIVTLRSLALSSPCTLGALVAPRGVKMVMPDMLETTSDGSIGVLSTFDIVTPPDKLGTGLELGMVLELSCSIDDGASDWLFDPVTYLGSSWI